MTEPSLAPHDRLVETPNGTLFVREVSGDNPPIVLMHGFPDDHSIYERLLPLLGPRRAVAFDWHGYGRSDRSELGGFSMKEHVSELEALLDALDIERAVLVGHDASGPDAVAFAVAHPQRVSHLVLLNTMFGHLPSLRLPEMIRLLADPDLIPLADAMVNDDAQRLWLLQLTADHWGIDAADPDGVAVRSILPQFFGSADQPDALAAIRAWTAYLFGSLTEQDVMVDSGVLGDLEVPVSVIFGEADRYLSPSLAREIAGLFTNPSLHLVPDASHWPQHDQPQIVADLLADIASN
ncbi:MAG: alpha/beta hydrolase [Acidimicrobiales bacterium]